LLSKRVDKPRGMWGLPLTREERLAKYTDCARRAISSQGVDALLARIESLEHCQDAREVVAAMTCSSIT